jgi:hypothetical protein
MKIVNGKNRLSFMVIFALILMLIAGGCGFSTGTESSFNEKGPIKVASAEDFANRVVPGWQRAQEAGLIVDIDLSKPIPGTDAEVTIEKVWYNPLYTYVLYTVKEPNRQYLMADKREIDIGPDKIGARNLSFDPLHQRWGGISREGFHQVMVFKGYSTPVPAREITLTMSEWRVPRWSLSGPVDTLDSLVSVKLPLSDEFLRETTEIIALDQTYEWKGRILRLKGMEIKSSKTLLYGEVALMPGETLNHISGAIKSGEQSAWLNYETIVPGDALNTFEFTFYAEPLNEWPAPVSLEIRAIEFEADQVLNFELDWTQFAGKQGEIEIAEGEDGATRFYDSIVRLCFVNPERWIELEIVEPENQPYIAMSTEPVTQDPLNNYARGLKVTNENGDILEVGMAAGGQIREDRFGIGFEIKASDERWQTSERIIITIGKPKARLVVKETIDLIY